MTNSYKKKETWIALDAMGGDYAPAEIVRGAVLAASQGVNVLLVGDKRRIENELKDTDSSRLKIFHASEVIKMGDHPVRAIKSKPDNSLSRAFELVRKNDASAVLSAGNSGAMLVASKWVLGDTPGIFRPAIAVPIPTPYGEAVMLDGGISTDCSPENLYQFAIMGHIYAKHVLKKDSPRISLLNIGEEQTKGNNAVKKAYEFLENSDLNFIGNIEGDELFEGATDVIVCDGFMGNVVLKVAEGTVRGFMSLMKDRLRQSGLVAQVGMILLRSTMKSLKKQMDWREYGGALLMGIRGNVIITHGKSNSSSIANALNFANRVADADLARLITEEITLNISKSPVSMDSGRDPELE